MLLKDKDKMKHIEQCYLNTATKKKGIDKNSTEWSFLFQVLNSGTDKGSDKELAANRNGGGNTYPRVRSKIFPLNALNCKNSFVSRWQVRQSDEKQTEMINDKREDLIGSPEIGGNGQEGGTKKKDWISNPTKRLEAAGNYPIKFFRATKKGRFTPVVLVIPKRPVCSYSVHKSNCHNPFDFTFSCDLTTCWELLYTIYLDYHIFFSKLQLFQSIYLIYF